MIRRFVSSLRRQRPDHQAPFEPPPVPSELSTATDFEKSVVNRTLPHSITSVQRILAVVDSVRYCTAREVPGAFVECGVWRGGSVVAMILTLQDLGIDDRDLYLYDTFEGMTEPTEEDGSPIDKHAFEWFNEAEESGDRAWPHFFNPDVFNEQMVRDFVLGTGYPAHRIHFVRGRVEDTLPGTAPSQVAFLRLDTDFYKSTKHEMIHLYPRLSPGGVLIVDDYGHWAGSKQAVDEYFAGEAPPILLSRIDYTGRIGIKH